MWNSWKSHALGTVIRAWMFHSGFYESLADRVEISTPLNSWKRGTDLSCQTLKFEMFWFTPLVVSTVVEGAFLHQRSQSPYDGDVFHETPIGLAFYSYLLKLNVGVLYAVFILCDALTAIALTEATKIFFKDIVCSLFLNSNSII